jgi:tRNA-modifying protein YgfZ
MFGHLNHYGLLKVSGTDSKKLLQGQVTCHIEEITESQTRMGALCNPQGRVLSLFHVFYVNEAYFLLMEKSLLSITQNILKKYAVFYKVQFADVTDDFAIIGAQNPSQKMNDALVQIPIGMHRLIIIANKKAAADDATMSWKQLNIQERIASIYPETSGKFLPHDIHLHELGAISFNKGCFTGQEIIARMHYRGKLKNHLYLAAIESDAAPQPGEDIFYFRDHKAEVAGSIVDVYDDEKNNYHALIVVDEKNAQDNLLFLQHRPHHFFKINRSTHDK